MASVGFSKSNSTIINGVISSSTVDMDGGVITSHGTPISPTDVPNKAYVDAVSAASIPSLNVNLSGVSWVEILTGQTGIFSITVKNMITNGPSASFSIAKNEATRQAAITRNNSCAGLTTEERLEIRWLPSTGIELRKNKIGYDGTYRVQYLEND